tara:strand:- start:771 stop:1073 length:303 start_codon:yes stop_codon:yes gene_type:complete
MSEEKTKGWKSEEIAKLFGDDTLFATDLDDSIAGVSLGFNSGIVVYDTEKIAKILMEREGMSHEDAWDHIEYNIIGAYVGDKTPIWMAPLNTLIGEEVEI